MKKILVIIMVMFAVLAFVSCDDSKDDEDKKEAVTYPLYDTVWEIDDIGSDSALSDFNKGEIWVFTEGASYYTLYYPTDQKYSTQDFGGFNESAGTVEIWGITYSYTHDEKDGTLVISSQSKPSTFYWSFIVSSVTASDLESYTKASKGSAIVQRLQKFSDSIAK